MGKTEEQTMPWRERKKEIRHNWLRPFIFVEWLCERLSNLLGRWAFLDILGHAGRLTILIAVIFYFLEAEERKNQAENQRKAKHYQAWQVINAAQGKRSNSGRIDALQDLKRDKVSLRGVDVSNAYLQGIDLKDADLADANFSGAVLWGANFSGANLRDANLSEAKLRNANFSGADLEIADLSLADLIDTNLSGTKLKSAKFFGAYLIGADLSAADLVLSDLSWSKLNRADLSDANLFAADLSGAILQRADISGSYLFAADFFGALMYDANLDEVKGWKRIRNIRLANIYGIKNPPDGFIEWAEEHGAVIMKRKDKWKALLKEEVVKKKIKMPDKYLDPIREWIDGI